MYRLITFDTKSMNCIWNNNLLREFIHLGIEFNKWF